MAILETKAKSEIESTRMNDVVHVKLGAGRRVAIPFELCQRLGIQAGDPLVLEASEHFMVLRPLDEVVREVQAFFRDAASADVCLSEQLIQERREEAKREKRD